eukprot:4730719-Amphidinium_carterae.1
MSPRKRQLAVLKAAETKKRQRKEAHTQAVMSESGSHMKSTAVQEELAAIGVQLKALPDATIFVLGSLLRSGRLESILHAPPPAEAAAGK